MSETITASTGLLSAFPYCDLDGTPWPDCDHQHMTTDPVELAIVQGIGEAILAAGLPRPFVRAGERIKTTWGCEKNTRLKSREAIVTCVTVVLYRDRQSMWHRPAYEYIGKEVAEGRGHSGMCLQHIERQDGAVWQAPKWPGTTAPFAYRLEWVSKLHGGIERAYDGPFRDDLEPSS